MTRLTKDIPIGNIIVDRHSISTQTLSLVKFLEDGGEVSPIKVALNRNGTYVLRDGRHRVTAYKLLGRGTIEARFSTKPMISFSAL